MFYKKLDYLETEVDKNILKINRKADRNKLKASLVSVSSAVLGASITIFLGLQIDSETNLLKNMALVFGALIAIINALESFFNFRSLWVKQKVTLLQLYTLRNEIDFYRSGLEENDEISERKVTGLFRDYQKIWETASSEWIRLRREQDEEKDAE